MHWPKLEVAPRLYVFSDCIQELGLQLALGPALMATKGPAPEVEQIYARTRALCQAVGETPQLIPTLQGLYWFYETRGGLQMARELGEQLVRQAQRMAGPMPRLEAHAALGTALFFMGDYTTARMHLEQGLSFTCWRGWVLAVQGQGDVGLAHLRQGLEAILATGQMLGRSLRLVLLAEAAGHAGRVEEGMRLLAEALAAIEASGRGELLAEAYRLQGELILRQDIPDAARAEACFHHALAIARRQQTKSWELQTAMSLSRLWQQQGKAKEARELLAPIYGWFTEGFDTADLQEAKALLVSSFR